MLRIILASRRHIELSIDDDESERRRVRVLSLAVSNNVYRREPSLIFTREALDQGRLGVYIAKPHSGLGMVWVLARAAMGLWTGDDRLDCLSAKNSRSRRTRKGSVFPMTGRWRRLKPRCITKSIQRR